MSLTVTIDGESVAASEGETVLECALRHDIPIPHLCTHPYLPPFGACRMCVVEIEGMPGYPTSCTTPATEGMVVRTNTPSLRDLRRSILGLIMLEHPSACLVCGKRDLCEQYRPAPEKAGRTTGCHTCNNKEVCEVRVLADELGLSELPVAPSYHQRPLDRLAPFIDRDLNLCILCGRCVRVCMTQQGQAAIGFVGRGSETHIGEAFGRSPVEAGCQFCGSCTDVCPTGSLADRYAKWYGKPDAAVTTTCLFCEEACALDLKLKSGRLVAASAAEEAVPICVLGRFATAEFLNGSDRLRLPQVRKDGVLRETEWKEALESAAERLKDFKGNSFALVCDTTSTLEDRHVFKKFTREVMNSVKYVEIEPDARGVSRTSLPEGTRAALVTGDFVDPAELEKLEFLIVQDCYPTSASDRADIVLPVAVFAEVSGTIADGSSEHRPLRKACEPPGQAKPEWQIITEMARALGVSGIEYDCVDLITKELGISEASLLAERETAPAAAKNVKARRTHFRGHRIDGKVRGLLELPLDDGLAAPLGPVEGEAAKRAEGFTILEKREIAPNAHEIVIEAPQVARKAQPGQFVIVMVDEKAERAPYTLADWDAEKGTITLVVLEMGQSSRKLALLAQGDAVVHLVGPLGIPLEIQNYGTVLLAGGCYGIGAIVPIARAMKEAGNRVIVVVEARSHYMHYYREKLESVSDELIQTTIDGSMGVKGHAVDVIGQKLEYGEKIDRVVAVGCPFMMMLVGQETQPRGVKTLAALNPIMLDGTGMCGACRVTVGEETKFACVDGPFFDAHLIDWDELWDRRAAYRVEEIQSVGHTEPVLRQHCETHSARCSR